MAKSDIGTYKELVYELLNNFEFLRDDVNQLYLACISHIRGKDYIRNVTLYEFFNGGCQNKDLPKIPTMSSVIRLNTKLQKENPHLRAKDWEEKQAHSKDYQEDLGYNVV